MSSQELPSDSARPSVVKSKSSPWLPRFPSKEPLSSAHKMPSVGIMPLRKRHSGFSPSSPLTPPTPSTPSLPPSAPSLPPARNPNRAEQTVATPPPLPPKSKSRPSTASSREDVTPWELQSSTLGSTPTSPAFDRSDGAPTPTLKSKPSSVHSGPSSVGSAQQPSVRSRSSSTATGLVEDVTPWELYPPLPEKNTKYHVPTRTSPAQTPTTASPPPFTATGLVEDVTPWELVPPPRESSSTSPHATSHLVSVDETSTLVSFDAAPRRAHALSQLPSSSPSLTLGTMSSQEFQQHKVQKTGPAEDVTPWELEPGPGTASRQRDGAEPQLSSSRGRSSLTIAQVEEVTPWELYPVPSTPPESTASGANGSNNHDDTVVNKKSARPGRPPSTSGSSKALSDLGFVRPRRSTGKSSNKNRQVGGAQPVAGPHQGPISSTPVQSPQPQVHDQHDADDEMPRQVSSRPRASSVTQRVGIKASNSFNGSINSPVAPALIKPSISDPTSKMQHKFSTADRVILRELRFMQDAHDAEFVIKGKGYPQQGGGVTAGKVHHAYREDLAPYPRCYESRIQDLDVWETLFCHQMCESWTWHVFHTPPTKVLDIGCGTGTWISSVAMIWPNCHFWGVDLVPTQPDYAKLGDRALASRVKWVQANFLEKLPFEDEQFDFIHVKRVALGVPENKWDALFEEFARILKPGGALEMIEEDLFFPGKPNDSDENADSETDFSGSSRRSSLISNEPPNFHSSTATALDILTPVSIESSDLDRSPMASSTNLAPLVPMPSRPSSPPLAPDLAKHVAFTDNEHSHGRATAPPSPRATGAELSSPDRLANVSPMPPHSRVTAKPSLQVKTGPNLQGSGTFASSAASFLGTVGNLISSPNPNQKPTDRANGFGVRRLSSGMPLPVTDTPRIQTQASSDNIRGQHRNPSSKHESYLLRSYKASRNPRDHTILEVIYSEMLSSRFINMTPLSLLTNYLEYHFVDVRTHPPLLYTFPPTALLHSESRFVTDSESEPESSEKESSDEGRDAIKPKPSKATLSKNSPPSSELPRSPYRCVLGKRTGDTPENDRWLTKSALLKHQSPYITLDGSRSNAYSPADKSGYPAGRGTHEKAARRKSSLPNATLNIDLRSLNMHLYLRAMEVLGCSEPMWEWVTQYQEQLGRRNGTRNETAGGPIKPEKSQTSLHSAGSGDSSNSVMGGIADMTRDDFEVLLSNFELDMQDQASVDYALQERMVWHVFSSPRDTRRKAFDEACRKWDKWVMRQEKKARQIAHRQSHHHGKNRHDVNDNGHGNSTPVTPHEPIHLSGDLLAARHEHNNGGNVNGKPSKYELASLPSPIPFNPSSLPPDKRLSRSMRVFVAWKPRDPSSPNQAVSSVGGP